MQSRIALLSDRGVVRVAGEDAHKLLQGVVTTDMDLLATQPAIHAALLTPQGKILFDFFVVQADDTTFLLETGAEQAAALAKRLSMYKLRAKVEIADASADYRVLALWGDGAQSPGETKGAVAFPDPRLPALGLRVLAPAQLANDIGSATSGVDATAADYHAHRIAYGVPEGGKDYALGDTFPHEADLDQLGGVSFDKGCFVGQEVVSRMQHRGTARKRVVPIEGIGAVAELQPGADITVGSATIGRIGSVAGRHALALLRLDRAAEAAAKGQALIAGGVEIKPRKPAWATFELSPTTAAETT